MKKNMWNKRNILRAIISGGVLIAALIIINLFLPAFPWMANHFGFALPGPRGLPYRIVYADRYYSNEATCAYAGWCQNASQNLPRQPLCEKKEVEKEYARHLVQGGIIFTFIGLPYPLMVPQPDGSRKLTPLVVFIAYSTDCYVPYTLEGGP